MKRKNTKSSGRDSKQPSRAATGGATRGAPQQELPTWAKLADAENEPFNLDDPPTDYDDPDVCYRIAMNNPHS